MKKKLRVTIVLTTIVQLLCSVIIAESVASPEQIADTEIRAHYIEAKLKV